jgi:hypothetical protein
MMNETMIVTITCLNKGNTSAANVLGEAEFMRSTGAGNAQYEKRQINVGVVTKGDGIPIVFPTRSKMSWEWLSRQKMKVSVSFSYDNGIQRASQSYCWELFIDTVQHSSTFTQCENRDAFRQ